MSLTTFLDPVGRTILGEINENLSNEKYLVITNPGIIDVQQTPNKQLTVQIVPLYFREFIGEKNKVTGTNWRYNRDRIVEGIDIDNDPRLVAQYNALFKPQPVATAPTTVRLFDEPTK